MFNPTPNQFNRYHMIHHRDSLGRSKLDWVLDSFGRILFCFLSNEHDPIIGKKIPQLYHFWQTYAVFTFNFFLCLKFISKDSRSRKHQTVKSLANRCHPALHQLFGNDQISHYTSWKCPTCDHGATVAHWFGSHQTRQEINDPVNKTTFSGLDAVVCESTGCYREGVT